MHGFVLQISWIETRPLPLHLLPTWPHRFLCKDSDPFWDSVPKPGTNIWSHVNLNLLKKCPFTTWRKVSWGCTVHCMYSVQSAELKLAGKSRPLGPLGENIARYFIFGPSGQQSADDVRKVLTYSTVLPFSVWLLKSENKRLLTYFTYFTYCTYLPLTRRMIM